MGKDIYDQEDVVIAYTREQAIADGVLVDISKLAREAGFKIPVAITGGLHYELNYDLDKLPDQSLNGRLWDVLNTLILAIKRSPNTERVFFKVIIRRKDGEELLDLYAVCGPGSNKEPVLTILLANED